MQQRPRGPTAEKIKQLADSFSSWWQDPVCAVCTKPIKEGEFAGLVAVKELGADTSRHTIMLQPCHVGCMQE